jgi:hypothetical protein
MYLVISEFRYLGLAAPAMRREVIVIDNDGEAIMPSAGLLFAFWR